jgi:CHAD domain-containing protein
MPISANRVQKSIRSLRKFLKKAPKSPTPKKIHKVRTNARRLETSLVALGLASKGNEKQLLRGLARIRSRTGKVRDADVLTGFVMDIDLQSEKNCMVRLLEHLGAEHDKQSRKLRQEVRKTAPQLIRRLKRSSSKLDKLVERARADHTDPLKTAAMAKAMRIIRKLQDPHRFNKSNLHPYRLRVKELRSVLQLADDSHQEPLLRKLLKVKDAVGEWHDWQELVAIASDKLAHGYKCKLLDKIRTIRDAKYETALALATELRTAHLDAVLFPSTSAQRFMRPRDIGKAGNDRSHAA